LKAENSSFVVLFRASWLRRTVWLRFYFAFVLFFKAENSRFFGLFRASWLRRAVWQRFSFVCCSLTKL